MCFQNKGTKQQTTMKMCGPGDPASQSASVTVSSEFCIQNSFKAAGWDGPASGYSNQNLTIILIFSGSSKNSSTPKQQEAV